MYPAFGADTEGVKAPFRFSALGPALVVLLTAGLAVAAMRGPARPVVGLTLSDESTVPAGCEPSDGPTEGPVAGPTVGPSPTTSCEPPEDGEGGDGGGSVEDAQRVADCEAAAGQSSGGGGEKLTGLDRAIEQVLENCIKNPQAPGLVNALEHLALNRERKEAREEERAARAEGREAANEARTADRDARKEAPEGANAAGKGAQGSGGPPSHARAVGHGRGQGNGS